MHLIALTLCTLTLAVNSTVLHAKSNTLDSIAAVVGQDIILRSEVDERLDLIYKQVGDNQFDQLPPRSVMEAQVLDRMVLEEIQLQMAQELGIRVDADEVTQALKHLAERNRQSLEQFHESMLEQTVNFAQFRAQIKRELIISKLQQRVISQRVKISEQDVENFLSSPIAKEKLAAEYHLYHLLFAVPEGAAEEAVTEAKLKVEQIKQQIQSKKLGFQQAVLTYSDGQNANQGGDMGWRRLGQMPALFAQAVKSMKPGSLSAPLKSGAGFHLLFLAEVRGNTAKNLEQTHVRHILVSPNAIRNEAQTKVLIDNIFNDLMSGDSFETLARTYSDDSATARSGGDLGWVTPGTMVPNFEKVMNSQPVGAITRPFQTRYGWHILEVLERRSEDVSQELQQATAKQMIFRRKFEEELESWLQEIRHDAFVEIRS